MKRKLICSLAALMLVILCSVAYAYEYSFPNGCGTKYSAGWTCNTNCTWIVSKENASYKHHWLKRRCHSTAGDSYSDSSYILKECTLTDIQEEPTCTETGVIGCIYCLQGFTVPATGHSELAMSTIAATCTKSGQTGGTKCAVCGEIIKAATIIPAKGHTSAAIEAVAPGCTEPGKTSGSYCSVCHVLLNGCAVIPATGHAAVPIKTVIEANAGDSILPPGVVFTCGHDDAEAAWYSMDAEKLISEGNEFRAEGAGIAVLAANAGGQQNACSVQVVIHSNQKMYLPDTLKTINAESFENTGAEEYILPEGIESIGRLAFADNAALCLLQMPDSLVYIDEDAFKGSTEIAFLCSPDSIAADFADEKSIPWATKEDN